MYIHISFDIDFFHLKSPVQNNNTDSYNLKLMLKKHYPFFTIEDVSQLYFNVRFRVCAFQSQCQQKSRRGKSKYVKKSYARGEDHFVICKLIHLTTRLPDIISLLVWETIAKIKSYLTSITCRFLFTILE